MVAGLEDVLFFSYIGNNNPNCQLIDILSEG
jgi:hypothetical protein